MDADRKVAESINYWGVACGLALVATGTVIPALIQIQWLRVTPRLSAAVESLDHGVLILTIVQVMLINTLRIALLYIGALVATEELYKAHKQSHGFIGLIIPIVIVPVTYQIMYFLFGVSYGFLAPTLIIALCMGITSAMKNSVPGTARQSLVVFLVVFGVQWLEAMPVMEGVGIGRGEIYREIKLAANLMNAEEVLNIIGFLFIFFTLVVATLLIQLLIVHNRELMRERFDRSREQELQVMRINTMETKALREVRSLTHDLKTPLTAIQGLTSVLQLMVDTQGEQAVAICDRINQAADNMNEMITDIVLQERRQPIDVSHLLTYATAQVSPQQGSCTISMRIEEDIPKILGNRVRLARALANILENSLQAMSETGGQIDIVVRSLPDHRVRIVISDNGPGVSEEDKPKLFALGFSTKGTAGLGLPFVGEVIRDHRGTIDLWSVPGVGTKVVIALPEVTEN